MQLEQRQVLGSRWNVLSRWREKEWWYTGVYDPASGAYFGWYFIRVNLVDAFAFSVFDPSDPEPQHFSRKLYLDETLETGGLNLRHHSRGLDVAYGGSAEAGWTFDLKRPGYEAQLDIRPTRPAFTRFDRELESHYGLMHFFHNRVSGTLRTPRRTYELRDALCYYDHCFGRVPRETGWHWLAVQNDDVALASLVNYGPEAQRYTQAWFDRNAERYREKEWIRLEQDVSFELAPGHRFDTPWRVTSTDLDLVVTPRQAVTTREEIPFVVDVEHSEVHVQVDGRIRIDGRWMGVSRLAGVFEQHGGRW